MLFVFIFLENVMVLTRTRNPSTYVRGLAYGVIKSHGLSTKLLGETDQDGCPDLFRRSLNPKESPQTVKAKQKAQKIRNQIYRLNIMG